MCSHLYTSDVSRLNMSNLVAVAGTGDENQARYPVQFPPTPPPTNPDDDNDVDDDAVSVSIESIAAALESGQRQSVRLPSTPPQLRQRNPPRFPPRSTQYRPAKNGNGEQRRISSGHSNTASQFRPEGENGREHRAGQVNGQGKSADGKQSGPPNR